MIEPTAKDREANSQVIWDPLGLLHQAIAEVAPRGSLTCTNATGPAVKAKIDAVTASIERTSRQIPDKSGQDTILGNHRIA